ncbi:MAG: hypothetical protein RR766_05510 [Longicatena sp.]
MPKATTAKYGLTEASSNANTAYDHAFITIPSKPYLNGLASQFWLRE